MCKDFQICAAGKGSGKKASVCTVCDAGKTSVSGESCQSCPFNTFSASGDIACTSCVSGKYSLRSALQCSSCIKGQYLHQNFTKLRNEATTALLPCLPCSPCPAGTQRVGCFANATSAGKCMSCGAGRKLVPDAGVCELCPENEYYDASNGTRIDLTVCSKCPRNSISMPGSTSLQDCVCTAGFIRVYTDKTTFKCGCEFGRYVMGTKCEECEDCPRGQYRSGCALESPGSCVLCDKACASDERLAGCGGLREGSCKPKTDLVRTPLCAGNSAGFGFYDFTSVFRANARELEFRCSDICDGRTEYDTVECDGPYACNMATCAEDVSEEGNMIPVRACPVVISNSDDEGTVLLKRREQCVPCKRCGMSNYIDGSSKYGDWGAGCVRECSQLLCSEGMVWDWTGGRCRTCDALSDIRLCSKDDTGGMSLLQRTVTGNLPLLYFPYCKGGGRNLLNIGYGKCKQCDDNSLQACTGSTYPANCKDGGTVQCKVCARTTQAQYVDLVVGRWLEADVWRSLHCQISACKDRNGRQWTGVESSGKVCTRSCASIVCADDEVLVPCRLPHQAYCHKVFPTPETVLPRMRVNTFYAGSELNLLDEMTGPHRGVASFENIFMVLPSSSEYQCVWNADGITDNTASPAGLSHVLWAPGQTADDLFKERGTRACRVWDVQGHVDMPLLPLQNTVGCSMLEDTDNKCLDRIILVNTEAYALSYTFSGDFGVVAAEPPKINAMFMTRDGEQAEGMLRAEHVGAPGKLFLMLRMHQRSARLAAPLSNDRALYQASWIRSLLVSFAVVDLTEYTQAGVNANVLVTPSMTVNAQQVSDEGINYVQEVFWAQPLAEHWHAWQTESSLFSVQRNGFADSVQCELDDDVSPWAQLELAPWLPVDTVHWAEQRNGSAMLLHVAVSCEFNGVQAECSDLQNIAEVFVLLQPYSVCSNCGDCVDCNGGCTDFVCAETTDTTLLAIRSLHEGIPDTPSADRLIAGSAARVDYKLQRIASFEEHMQQAHPTSAYGQCAVLLTTTLTESQASSSQSIMCVAADGTSTVLSQLAGGKYGGAFSTVVHGRPVFLLLVRDFDIIFASLQCQNLTNSSSAQEVLDSSESASTWLCAAVSGENITALYVENERGSVGLTFARLLWVSDTELGMQAQGTQQSLGDDWMISLNPWQDFARVIISPETEYALMVWVERQMSDLLGDILVLRACVCAATVPAICSSIVLAGVPVDSDPSFVSAAFLRDSGAQHEWAIGVRGRVHSATLSQESLKLQRVYTSVYTIHSLQQHRHFVKVQHLFYCFGISETEAAVQPSILAYLPRFQRWKSLSREELPAVYAVLVVPPASNSTLKNSEFTFTDDRPDVNISSMQTSIVRKTLILKVWWASYKVTSMGDVAQPLYERVSDAPAGDDLTQILASPHKVNARAQSPSSLMPMYTVTSNNLTVNRALGLPSAYGRYGRVGSSCIFQHHVTAAEHNGLLPAACVEDLHIAFSIADALCQDDADIHGLYTQFDANDAAVEQMTAEYTLLSQRPVYARRISSASRQLSTIQRYIYYIDKSGWVLSGTLGLEWSTTCATLVNSFSWSSLSSECGYMKLFWPAGHNDTRPPSSPPVQICKSANNNYMLLEHPKTGQLWQAYYARAQQLTMTQQPRCCGAGQQMLADVCTDCPAGHYAAGKWNVCIPCSQGTYTATPGSSSCTVCAAGTHAVGLGGTACTSCPSDSLCAAAKTRPGISLMYAQQTTLAEWLQLLFNVPCNTRLQLFGEHGTMCNLAATLAAATICADNNKVLVLIHAERSVPSSMHFFQNGQLRTIIAELGECIYMQQGVFWIDAVLLKQAPRQREIEIVLERQLSQSKLRTPALPSPGIWRRQRHVLNLTPLQDMRVELLFQRDAVSANVAVAVGVDDMQLSVVLSEFPAIVQQNALCAPVRVPTKQELATIGLQHLLRGNSSADDWERLHVTVAVSTREAGCQFSATLFHTLDDGTCTADPLQAPTAHSLHSVGCSLTPASDYVLGAYAECNIELPVVLTLGVILVPTSAHSTCFLSQSTELVVTLRPHTQLYSCGPAHFRDTAGACVACVANTNFCPLGTRLRGCPALEAADARNCIECLEGRELVNSGAAVYVPHDGEYCSWNCSVGFFYFQFLGTRTCRLCAQPPDDGCAAGTTWSECSPAQDAGCFSCPDLRLTAGPYAANEEYLQIVNKSNTCQTQCKAGSYRSFDGLCKQCWGRAQLLLHAGPGFHFFKACSQSTNAQAFPCVARQGEMIVSSDTGEGTQQNPFTGACASTCLPGWFPHSNECAQCIAPLHVVHGSVTLAPLPSSAFTWTANASAACQFECLPPYTRTAASAPVQTCVLCSGVCQKGSYPVAPYCKCTKCLM